MASSEKLEINQCRTCYSTTKGLKLLTDLTKCSGNQHISYAELLTDVCNINVSIPQKTNCINMQVIVYFFFLNKNSLSLLRIITMNYHNLYVRLAHVN